MVRVQTSCRSNQQSKLRAQSESFERRDVNCWVVEIDLKSRLPVKLRVRWNVSQQIYSLYPSSDLTYLSLGTLCNPRRYRLNSYVRSIPEPRIERTNPDRWLGSTSWLRYIPRCWSTFTIVRFFKMIEWWDIPDQHYTTQKSHTWNWKPWPVWHIPRYGR